MKPKLLSYGLSLTAFVLTSAILPSSLAQEKSDSKSSVPARQDHLLLSVTGRIEAIDHATREITLKGPQGRVETYSVSKDVKRLDEAKVGDYVTIKYYLGFAAELREPTAEEKKTPLVVLEGAGKAPASAAPAAAGARRIKAVVTVEGLDRPTETITVKGPAGRYYTARVADPANLTKMRIGDTIVVTLTEAAAVSLDKAEKSGAE
jgi:Cu/Ag efflux protein CusF